LYRDRTLGLAAARISERDLSQSSLHHHRSDEGYEALLMLV
jgi:hypothetical protein